MLRLRSGVANSGNHAIDAFRVERLVNQDVGVSGEPDELVGTGGVPGDGD